MRENPRTLAECAVREMLFLKLKCCKMKDYETKNVVFSVTAAFVGATLYLCQQTGIRLSERWQVISFVGYLTKTTSCAWMDG